MYCGNASKNHKLKFVVIAEAKELWLFEDTKANFIPVHYENQPGA